MGRHIRKKWTETASDLSFEPSVLAKTDQISSSERKTIIAISNQSTTASDVHLTQKPGPVRETPSTKYDTQTPPEDRVEAKTAYENTLRIGRPIRGPTSLP
ncbi:hypothetical protein JTE90_028177 [Oedothorax gibbosus]|uniref:Uncharacterized protein n=1 Tax=Oedothorax gibbosus TaxID=931172 RepID=A0AAV6UD82_9ARAC|nr:hypothetical protein JTE90_028177 [Oedothorax gibbosus]